MAVVGGVKNSERVFFTALFAFLIVTGQLSVFKKMPKSSAVKKGSVKKAVGGTQGDTIKYSEIFSISIEKSVEP